MNIHIVALARNVKPEQQLAMSRGLLKLSKRALRIENYDLDLIRLTTRLNSLTLIMCAWISVMRSR